MIEFQLDGIDQEHLARSAIYCDEVLRDQPFRRTVFCLVTDLVHAQLVWSTRTRESGIQRYCTKPASLEYDAWGLLLFVLFATPRELGWVSSETSIEGSMCKAFEWIGSGTTSNVHVCQYQQQGAVLKIAHAEAQFPALVNEAGILRTLARYDSSYTTPSCSCSCLIDSEVARLQLYWPATFLLCVLLQKDS